MDRQEGFTLIEVLVVIVIIGVLSAIAIPAFTGHASRAHDGEAKSAADQARKAIREFGVENDGFTGASAADLVAIDSSLKEANDEGRLFVSGTSSGAPTRDSYVVAVKAKHTGTMYAFYLAQLGAGPPQRLCTPAGGNGGCGAPIPGLSFPGFGSVGAW